MNTAATTTRRLSWETPARRWNSTDVQIREICNVYFGGVTADKIARMKLNMIMSDVGWGLWAAIQAKISTIDFDFWGWAMDRWGRAVQKMDFAEFPRWLEEVQV